MASRLFLDYFDRCKHLDFSFEFFRTEILPMITPKKMKLNPNAEQKIFINQLKDSIVSNLAFNPYFYKFVFRHEELVLLENILLSSEKYDQNKFVQLIFLLHLSKANIEDKTSWNNFFLFLGSINTINTSESILKNDLDEFLHQLKKCKKFTDKIFAVGKEISGVKEIQNNFEDLEIVFISSSISGLNGFSGINSIYIDLTELIRKHRALINSVYEAKAQTVLRFECLRLFVHESCHVLIRQGLNDLNFSSPGLSKISNKYSLPEAGVVAEENIFSHRIDWMSSVMTFNFDYCIEYLTNILENQDVSFDFHKAKCSIDTRKMYLMAIDYKIPMPCFY